MKTKQELQTELDRLKNKWKDFEPFSNVDKSYWQYRCDRTMMIRLRSQIKNYTKYVKEEKKIEAESDISNYAEKLFSN